MDSTVRNAKMLIMHSEGMTYQEIADEFGITRQRAQQAVSALYRRNGGNVRFKKSVESIVYPKIREYFCNNPKMTYTGFCRRAFGRTDHNFVCKIERAFRGYGARFTVVQINQICAEIGKPFEEVFARNDAEEDKAQSRTISSECE